MQPIVSTFYVCLMLKLLLSNEIFFFFWNGSVTFLEPKKFKMLNCERKTNAFTGLKDASLDSKLFMFGSRTFY